MTQEAIVISLVINGIVELVKKLLPSSINSKIYVIIAVAVSIGIGIAFSIINGYNFVEGFKFTSYVLGLSQSSYNFLLESIRDFSVSKVKKEINEQN